MKRQEVVSVLCWQASYSLNYFVVSGILCNFATRNKN